jgi:hypothetical protein
MKRFLCVLCILCGCHFAYSIDREALTFTKYDLRMYVDPAQHGIEAYGTVTVRNDSASPQKYVVLQVSSSLEWREIYVGGKKASYVVQPYTTDIDHTGAVSEAIVTLPKPLAPHESAELQLSYGGTIEADTTRAVHAGAPADVAARGEWDALNPDFSAVRGVGQVIWYPVATEAASLANGEELWDALARWWQREASAQMLVGFHLADEKLRLVTNADPAKDAIVSGACIVCTEEGQSVSYLVRDFSGVRIPVFAMAGYRAIPSNEKRVTVLALPGGEAVGRQLAQIAALERPVLADWLGEPKYARIIADMASRDAAPAEAGRLYLTPFAPATDNEQRKMMAYQIAHASFRSPRLWMSEGIARFASVLEQERQGGRGAALELLRLDARILAAAEETTQQKDGKPQSLITTGDELFYGTKAAAVWWMLRDMVGDEALKRAIGAYRPDDDKEPAYFQHLLETESKKQLEWFFDDWVYRDRGLPDFRVVSAFPRKTLGDTYLLTVTIENAGGAGAEVPVIVHSEHGDVQQRLLVPAHQKATTRIPVPEMPLSVDVNDGSVPESTTANKTFTIPPAPANP